MLVTAQMTICSRSIFQAVTVANLIESKTRIYKSDLLISDSTYELLNASKSLFRRVGSFQSAGANSDLVRVYECFATRGSRDDAIMSNYELQQVVLPHVLSPMHPLAPKGGEHPPNFTVLEKTWCKACWRRHGRDTSGVPPPVKQCAKGCGKINRDFRWLLAPSNAPLCKEIPTACCRVQCGCYYYSSTLRWS